MSPQSFFLMIAMILGTVMIIFAMKYASAFARAMAESRDATRYRELVEEAQADRSNVTARLASIEGTTTRNAERLETIERILKEVD